MSATNSTTHYSLPSFVGSDKPAWLVDWNGAMASIDSAIYEAKSTADQAVTAAAAVASDVSTLSGTVSTQGSSITTLSETLTTAVGNINTINGNINTINSLIGNGTPTTTDQTIIGAINEINAEVGNISGTVSDIKNSFYQCGKLSTTNVAVNISVTKAPDKFLLIVYTSDIAICVYDRSVSTTQVKYINQASAASEMRTIGDNNCPVKAISANNITIQSWASTVDEHVFSISVNN